MSIEYFDLVEYQQRARETCSPKQLFHMWEEVCRFYDRGLIGSYELDEMKTLVFPMLKQMSALRIEVDGARTQYS